MELDILRENIDRVDAKILELLNERFDYCIAIGEIKKREGMQSVYVASREQEIIDYLSQDEEYPGLVKTIWPVIMYFSRELQKQL